MKSSFLSRYPILAIGLIAFICSFSSGAFGQLNSTTAAITLKATLGESLTVTPASPSVTFTLVSGGTANGSAGVPITTAWVLNPTRANVVLDGYFASAAAALTDGGSPANNIPTSEVLGQLNAGAFNPFTGTAALGPAGAGLTLFTQAITAANRAGNRADTLNLQINLAAQPLLPAGTYTGTLTLQAQAL